MTFRRETEKGEAEEAVNTLENLCEPGMPPNGYTRQGKWVMKNSRIAGHEPALIGVSSWGGKEKKNKKEPRRVLRVRKRAKGTNDCRGH